MMHTALKEVHHLQPEKHSGAAVRFVRRAGAECFEVFSARAGGRWVQWGAPEWVLKENAAEALWGRLGGTPVGGGCDG